MLKKKIIKAQKVIQEAQKKFGKNKLTVAWTGGKDSTVLLHIIKTLYRGKIPFVVFFNDSTMEFKEVYDFIHKIRFDWNLNLITVTHLPEDLETFRLAPKDKKLEISRTMKINVINYALSKYKWQAMLSGIRRDEHPARATETYFSKRETHMRIHPILDFTEQDIWQYIREFKVPYVNLYDKGYRSLGEKPFTKKSLSNENERSGREPGKERFMQSLRKLGYW